MIKISIHDDTNPQPKFDGKMIEQIAWVHIKGSAFPKEFKVTKRKPSNPEAIFAPYPKGEYTFDESCIYVDHKNFDRLAIEPVLIPYPSEPKK